MRRIPIKNAFSLPDSIIIDIDLEIFLQYMCGLRRGGVGAVRGVSGGFRGGGPGIDSIPPDILNHIIGVL